MIRFLVAVSSNKALRNAEFETHLSQEEIAMWYRLDVLSQIIRETIRTARGGGKDAISASYATTEDLMLTLGLSGLQAAGLLEKTSKSQLVEKLEWLYNEFVRGEVPLTEDKKKKLLALAWLAW